MIRSLPERGLRRLRRIVGAPAETEQTYAIGDVTLRLPSSHALPYYQATNRLYDRFPAVLARHLPPGVVVDIGANVGDTAAALTHGAAKTIVCIEPDPVFLALLKQNLAALSATGSTILCVDSAVGSSGVTGSLESARGTTRFIASDAGGLELMPLDDLLAGLTLKEPVSLIKCDVDGYDGGALLSGSRTLETHHPLLFFENEVQTAESVQSLAALYHRLKEAGYSHYTVFDNFGAVMTSTGDIEVVMAINDYVQFQNRQGSTRTIFYIDVLASADNHRERHKAAVRDYLEAFAVDAR